MAILFDGNTQVGGVTTLPVRAEDVSYGDSNVGSALDSVLNGQLTTSGLNFTKCNYVSGGYAKLGKLVIVELRITTNVDIAEWGEILNGLPTSNGIEVPMSTVYTGNASRIVVCDVSNTRMRANVSITSGATLNISGVYLTT